MAHPPDREFEGSAIYRPRNRGVAVVTVRTSTQRILRRHDARVPAPFVSPAKAGAQKPRWRSICPSGPQRTGLSARAVASWIPVFAGKATREAAGRFRAGPGRRAGPRADSGGVEAVAGDIPRGFSAPPERRVGERAA